MPVRRGDVSEVLESLQFGNADADAAPPTNGSSSAGDDAAAPGFAAGKKDGRGGDEEKCDASEVPMFASARQSHDTLRSRGRSDEQVGAEIIDVILNVEASVPDGTWTGATMLESSPRPLWASMPFIVALLPRAPVSLRQDTIMRLSIEVKSRIVEELHAVATSITTSPSQTSGYVISWASSAARENKKIRTRELSVLSGERITQVLL